MENKRLAVFMAVGLTAAIAVPTIAFGNARNNRPGAQAAQTPFVTRLSGANEVPNSTPGAQTADPDGFGSAAVTFDLAATTPNVCWDLSYGNLTGTPLMAHIHGPAAVGANAGVVIAFTPFSALGASSATGCRDLTPTEAGFATSLVADPASFYVNVHTSDFPGGAIRGQLAAGPAPTGEAHMLPVPLRAYDSRDASGAKIVPFEKRTISLATGKNLAGTSIIAVPPGATAAIVTLTVTDTSIGVGGNGGFLKMYAAGVTEPATSSINWAGADQNVSVTAQVAVDAAGQITISDGANSTHFVVDVIGYLF
jgi:CHRD domain